MKDASTTVGGSTACPGDGDWHGSEGEASGRNTLGERIRIDGLSFEVVRITTQNAGWRRQHRPAGFHPVPARSAILSTRIISATLVQLRDQRLRRIERTVRNILAEQHRFNPADQRGLMVFDADGATPPVFIITIGLKILLASSARLRWESVALA